MTTGISQNKLDNRKVGKQLATLSKRAKKSQLNLSDLVIPLSSLTVLILLTFFVFIPMVKTANESRAELKKVEQKLSELEILRGQLNEVDEVALLEDLIVAKTIIPKVLQVSNFVFYIDNLAESKDLVTREISAGDVNIGAKTNESEMSQGVSGPLSYSGRYQDVLDFLEEMQGYSPYLVTLKNISLSGGEENWTVSFDLVGYYIPEDSKKLDLYLPFTPYTTFSEVIDIFSQRVSKFDE
ncbi:hypothetical protein K8R20_01225 [bacterium]|nr:hypothetical protein [bacterium]